MAGKYEGFDSDRLARYLIAAEDELKVVMQECNDLSEELKTSEAQKVLLEEEEAQLKERMEATKADRDRIRKETVSLLEETQVLEKEVAEERLLRLKGELELAKLQMSVDALKIVQAQQRQEEVKLRKDLETIPALKQEEEKLRKELAITLAAKQELENLRAGLEDNSAATQS